MLRTGSYPREAHVIEQIVDGVWMVVFTKLFDNIGIECQRQLTSPQMNPLLDSLCTGLIAHVVEDSGRQADLFLAFRASHQALPQGTFAPICSHWFY